MTTASPPEPTSLNTVEDETTIYQGGTLIAIFPKDLVGNKAAITQLCNAYNLSVREKTQLGTRIKTLEEEDTVKRFFPVANGVLSFINVLGILLFGFGTTYMNQAQPPAYCEVLLWLGILIALISAAAQPFVPTIIKLIGK
jgi:hypothetical protein